MGEVANFNLGMGEEFLDVVPEDLTDALLEMEQKCIAEEEARIKDTAGDEEEPPRKFTVKGLAEAFADQNNLLKKFENMDPNTETFSLTLCFPQNKT